ncbi:hypothetical protein EG329_003718 [Mollisiaceae sp. DMI_Dod_QoI]|nr:hypothetical protein EG329_003718 [Helotiales sp. DMI_Dod_QoI]
MFQIVAEFSLGNPTLSATIVKFTTQHSSYAQLSPIEKGESVDLAAPAGNVDVNRRHSGSNLPFFGHKSDNPEEPSFSFKSRRELTLEIDETRPQPPLFDTWKALLSPSREAFPEPRENETYEAAHEDEGYGDITDDNEELESVTYADNQDWEPAYLPSNAAHETPYALPIHGQTSTLPRSSLKVCELCWQLFDGSEQLWKHLTANHPEMPNSCGRKECPKVKDKRAILRHLETSKAHRDPASILATRNASILGGSTTRQQALGPCSILIRRLPLDITKDKLQNMVVWSKEFIEAEVLSDEQSEHPIFRSAILRFRSLTGASQAKKLLEWTSRADVPMLIDILFESQPSNIENTAPSVPSLTTSKAKMRELTGDDREDKQYQGIMKRTISVDKYADDLLPEQSRVELPTKFSHEEAKVAPMGELHHQSLLTTLRVFAATDGPLGQEEQGWELLRENLVAVEYDDKFLDQHSSTILSLWYDCIEEAKNRYPKTAGSHPTPLDAATSASVPFAPMQEEDARSDISRSSSIASITDSIFSMMSGSSMSSIGGPQEANERFILLLLGDEDILSLCEQAVQTILPERFERNLRRLLKAFAAELKKEAQNPMQRQAANFVRFRARNSAHRIRNSLDKNKHPQITSYSIPLASITRHAEGEPEEESDESDGVESEDEPDDLDNLEQFIKTSNAMATLRRSLRAFILPTKEEHLGPQTISEENSINQTEEDDASSSKEQILDISEATLHTEDQNDNIAPPAPKQETEQIIDDEAGSSGGIERLEATYDLLHHKHLSQEKSTSNPQEIVAEPRCRQSLVEHLKSRILRFLAWLEMLPLGTSHLMRRSVPPDGKTRIKWRCRCGHLICDDFLELESGAAKRYKQSRERRSLQYQYKKSAVRPLASQTNVPSRIQSFVPPPRHRIQQSSIFFYTLVLHIGLSLLALDFNVLPFFNLSRPAGNEPATNWVCCYPIKALFLLGAVSLLCTAWFIAKISISILRQWKPFEIDVRENSHTNGGTIKSSFSTSVTKFLSQGVQLFRGLIRLDRGRVTKEDSELPRFNSLDELDASPSIPMNPSSELLFLLLCYNEGQYATRLLQLDLIKLQATSDKVLFKLLRTNYKSMQGNWVSWCSLRTLSWIKFVHFEMYKSELVDVRKIDDIPPPNHVEYRYLPAPPDLIPPVGDRHMMHLFQNPDCAEDEALCVSRFPKKLKEKLKCNGGVNPGWGLQFVEGWDWKKIWLIVFAFFGLGSLLIGVLWARYEHSIQDAFAIAAYMIGFATVTVGTAQALLMM